MAFETLGERGGQEVDVAKVIRGFLGPMRADGRPAGCSVMKELLQNADDAGATEIAVLLDERPSWTNDAAGQLIGPAILVRNNAPFRSKHAGDDADDFEALRAVQYGHKSKQATAAGRFGIGFNSVYILTETPLFFSRFRVQLFDLNKRVITDDVGKTFRREHFQKSGDEKRGDEKLGELKNILASAFPKEALGGGKTFLELMGGGIDYKQVVFRLPLRASVGASSMSSETFETPQHRERLLGHMVDEAERSVLFLKSVRQVAFGVLASGRDGVRRVAEVTVSANPPAFVDFEATLRATCELEPAQRTRERIACPAFERVVTREDEGKAPVARRFHVYHVADFAERELAEAEAHLRRNKERATPWGAMAVPLDEASFDLDGRRPPAWRTFLPLIEPGPCGAIFHGAFFVGNERHRLEHVSDGSDEARRKTQWNERLIKYVLVRLLRDESLGMLGLLGDLPDRRPRDYLSLFPAGSGVESAEASPLSQFFRACFASAATYVRVRDIWGEEVDLFFSDGTAPAAKIQIERVAKWALKYSERFRHRSKPSRRFVPFSTAEELAKRITPTSSFEVAQRELAADAARDILAFEEPPAAEDLDGLLKRLDEATPESLHGLWALRSDGSEKLLRFDPKKLYIVAGPDEPPIHRTLRALGVTFLDAERVDPACGLAALEPAARRAFASHIVPADDASALALLQRVDPTASADRIDPKLLEDVARFLEAQDPERLPESLRLPFFVSCAAHKEDRTRLGTIFLRSEPATNEPGMNEPSRKEEDALWEGLLRSTFPEVAPARAPLIRRLLRHSRRLERSFDGACRLALVHPEEALEALHRALAATADASASFSAELSRPDKKRAGLRPEAERAAALIIRAADRAWDRPDFDEARRKTVLLLPMHRTADGRLLSLDPEATAPIRERFMLQSRDDVRDAPVDFEDKILLHSEDRELADFYRKRLGLEECDFAAALAACVHRLARPGPKSRGLVRYIAATLPRLSTEGLSRVEPLLKTARAVPCEDGEWRTFDQCVDARGATRALVGAGWPPSEIPAVVSGLAPGFPIAFDATLHNDLIAIFSRVEVFGKDEIPGAAASSKAAALPLADRARLLYAFQGSWPQRFTHSPELLALPCATLGGSAPLSTVTVLGGAHPRVPALLGLALPRCADVERLASTWKMPFAAVREVLERAFQRPRVEAADAARAIVAKLGEAWPGLGDAERTAALEYLHEVRNYPSVPPPSREIELVRTRARPPAWRKPADVLSPTWSATLPPALADDRRPDVDGASPAVLGVWDAVCGLRTAAAVLAAVARSVAAGDIESKAPEVIAWIGRVCDDAALGASPELAAILRDIAWAPAVRASQWSLEKPGDVLLHASGPLLRGRFRVLGVDDVRIPPRVRGLFMPAPSGTAAALEDVAACLESAGTDASVVAAKATYELIRGWIDASDDLRSRWHRLARDRRVFRLFRGVPDRLVRSTELFIGGKEDVEAEDYGEVLRCLKAAAAPPPAGIVALYRHLGVECDAPSTAQIALALASETLAGKADRKTHKRLVAALAGASWPQGLGAPVEAARRMRVLTCAGTFAPIGGCYAHDALGRGEQIAKGQELVIDAANRANADLLEWLAIHVPGAVRSLDAAARRELAASPRPAEESPLDASFLAPWRDWLEQLRATDSEVRARATEVLGSPPGFPVAVRFVDKIPVRFVVPEGAVEPAESWPGPSVQRDTSERTVEVGIAAVVAADRDGPAAVASLDRELAAEVFALLSPGAGASVDALRAFQELVEQTLERPRAVLADLHASWTQRLIEQYHAEAADPDFAERYHRWRRTALEKREPLAAELREIVMKAYVATRRTQIEGHGYDEKSVFAELVQNAEDAYRQWRDLGRPVPERPSVVFRYSGTPRELTVEHHGRPLNHWREPGHERPLFKNDVERLLTISGSFKPHGGREGLAQTVGRFGLGFKSVYLLTDEPRLHSGRWHFRIQACCLPVPVPEPSAWSPAMTRVVLPLTARAAALPAPTAEEVCSLLPFLDAVVALRLEEPGKPALEPSLYVEHEGPGAGAARWLRLSLRGATHVKGGVAGLIRIRARATEAQLGIALDATSLPTGWASAFKHDVYAVLPIQVKLACGIGVSHRFEVQSGRTHLVDPATNAGRFDEIAALLEEAPGALRALSAPDRPLREVFRRFWTLWRWDHSEEQAKELARAFAKALVALAARHEVVPTLDKETCVALDGRPVFDLRKLPVTLSDELVKHAVKLPVAGGPVSLSATNVLDSAALGALVRAAEAADGPRGREALRVTVVGWTELGAAFREHGWLARDPALVSAMARGLEADELPQQRRVEILAWLRACKLRAVDGSGATVEDVAPNLLAWSFDGRDDLPARKLRRLSEAYDGAAVALLREAGLRAGPSAGDLQRWMGEGLTAEECGRLLRFFAGSGRWQRYRTLDETVRGRWFATTEGRLTPADAAARDLLPEDLSSDPPFRAWLGIVPQAPAPPPPPPPPPPPDPRKVLEAIHAWWSRHGAAEARLYDESLFPEGRAPSVSAQYFAADRRAWMTLFLLGATFTMGRTQPEQHREFLRLCESQGWLEVFADPELRAERWLGVLESYLERNLAQADFYHWMRLFVSIFQFARWMRDYVEVFLAADRMPDPFAIDHILIPALSPAFSGGGPGSDAPTLARTLGLGACFVLRELARQEVLKSPHVHEHCYPPVGAVARLLEKLECDHFRGGRSCSAADSRLVHGFLKEHLDGKGTFGGDFDLPLVIFAGKSPDERSAICGGVDPLA